MGYSPAAMGAATVTRPQVMLITGDGSFQMTLQELATCVAET
jgi:thiamine pyrophosphate-dependent acetolactate synthase large subunit-like protein